MSRHAFRSTDGFVRKRSAGGLGTVLTWRPQGPPAPGVFDSWEQLYAALEAVEAGPRFVCVSGIGVIPPGVWDLGNVRFLSENFESPATLIISDGSSSPEMIAGFADAIQVFWRGSAPFTVTTSDEPALVVERGARLVAQGNTAPFVVAEGVSASLFIALVFAGVIEQDSGTPLFEATEGAIVNVGMLSGFCGVGDNTLASDAISSAQILVASPAPQALGGSQPGVLGFFNVFIASVAELVSHVAADPSHWQAPLDTGAPFPVAAYLDQLAARLAAIGA